MTYRPGTFIDMAMGDMPVSEHEQAQIDARLRAAGKSPCRKRLTVDEAKHLRLCLMGGMDASRAAKGGAATRRGRRACASSTPTAVGAASTTPTASTSAHRYVYEAALDAKGRSRSSAREDEYADVWRGE